MGRAKSALAKYHNVFLDLDGLTFGPQPATCVIVARPNEVSRADGRKRSAADYHKNLSFLFTIKTDNEKRAAVEFRKVLTMRKVKNRKTPRKSRSNLAVLYRRYFGLPAAPMDDSASLEQPSPLISVPSYTSNSTGAPIATR
jgi:hypothetical protein